MSSVSSCFIYDRSLKSSTVVSSSYENSASIIAEVRERLSVFRRVKNPNEIVLFEYEFLPRHLNAITEAAVRTHAHLSRERSGK